jgi:hypothetical protein
MSPLAISVNRLDNDDLVLCCRGYILRECQPLSKRLNLLRVPRTGYEPAHEKDQNGTWNDDMRRLGNHGPFLGPEVEGVHDERGGLGME